jgi:hypothetical protein
MTDHRADELKKGDVLSIRGDRWTVVKAKVHGKHVRLTIDGRRGSFTDDVKVRTLYDVIDVKRAGETGSSTRPRSTGTPGPLHSPDGAQTKWAEPQESADAGREWSDVLKRERPIVDHLGARLVGVEVEDGKLIVPSVTDATILGHLATMHSRRFDGVTLNEAKAWARKNDPGGTSTAVQTMDALTLERAHELHAQLHVDFMSLERPHWHRERAPR